MQMYGRMINQQHILYTSAHMNDATATIIWRSTKL